MSCKGNEKHSNPQRIIWLTSVEPVLPAPALCDKPFFQFVDLHPDEHRQHQRFHHCQPLTPQVGILLHLLVVADVDTPGF